MNDNGTSTAWMQSEAGQNLQKRLTDEHTLNSLDHLLAKVDNLTKVVDSLVTIMEKGPGMIAMGGDMVDEAYRAADAQGVNLEERMRIALTMAEKLTDPTLVDKLDGLLKLVDQAPGLVAMTMDIVDEKMKAALDKGFDLGTLAEIAASSNRALTAAKAEPPIKVGGFWRLWRVLKDPDRQRGLGFLMNFLKHLGRNL